MNKKSIKKPFKSIPVANSKTKIPLPEKKDNGTKLFLITGILLLVTFLVFSPSLKNALVNWDDWNYLRDNPVVRDFSWQNIQHLFYYKTYIMGNYHPLTMLTYMAEYRVSGIEPWLFHLDNIILHLINIVLVAMLVHLLTGKYWVTLITACLFAVHPMRVESVVWASERKDVLYAMFFFLSLIFYAFYFRKRGNYKLWYAASLLLFIMSILSKGQAVVLPLTLFLVDYWYRKKIDLKMIPDKLPYIFVSLFFGILAVIAQSSSLTTERLASHSLAERLLFAAFNIPAYLYKLVFPYDLACFYGYPAPEGMPLIYGGAVLAIILLVLLFTRFRHNISIMFGSLFFLFTIVIVIQILPIGNAIIADRYTYIPYFGLFFIIAMLLDPILTGNNKSLRKMVMALLFIQLGVFAVASFVQSYSWRDNESLWHRALNNDPEQPVALNSLGLIYLDQQKYDTAIYYLNKAMISPKPYPEKYKVYNNMGKALSETGKPLEAIESYRTALIMAPTFFEGNFGMGLVYTDIGRYDSAISKFSFILSVIRPGHADSYYSRAIAYNKKQMTDSAIADYTRAIKVKPDYTSAYTNRGNIYFKLKEYDLAITDYNRALTFTPEDGRTFLNRSFAYFMKKDFVNALADANKAKSLKTGVDERYVQDLEKQISLSPK